MDGLRRAFEGRRAWVVLASVALSALDPHQLSARPAGVRRGTTSLAFKVCTTSPRSLRVSLLSVTIPRSGRDVKVLSQ